MTASLPIPDLEDLTRERELVAEMLRRSRLTLLYGEAHCGKTTLLRSVCSQEGADIAVLFDSWYRPLLPRLRDWMHAALCARLGRETVGPPPESCLFTENVRVWRARLGVRFLVVFDQFEHFLIQSPTDEGVNAFAEEFIRAASSPVDGVHFLLSLREEEKFRLVRFQRSIPGLYDSWIRLATTARNANLTRHPENFAHLGLRATRFSSPARCVRRPIHPTADSVEHFGCSTAGSRSSTGRGGAIQRCGKPTGSCAGSTERCGDSIDRSRDSIDRSGTRYFGDSAAPRASKDQNFPRSTPPRSCSDASFCSTPASSGSLLPQCFPGNGMSHFAPASGA